MVYFAKPRYKAGNSLNSPPLEIIYASEAGIVPSVQTTSNRA